MPAGPPVPNARRNLPQSCRLSYHTSISYPLSTRRMRDSAFRNLATQKLSLLARARCSRRERNRVTWNGYMFWVNIAAAVITIDHRGWTLVPTHHAGIRRCRLDAEVAHSPMITLPLFDVSNLLAARKKEQADRS